MGPTGRANQSTTTPNENTSVNNNFPSVRIRPTTCNLMQEASFNTDVTLKEDFISNVVIEFICERMIFDGRVVPQELKRRQEVDDGRAKRIALMILIRTDQDDSSSNELLAQLLCQIKITEKYFESVAQKIFKDGIDWRRIISFLYMSYKLILKAVDEKGSIDLVISWLKRYFCQYLVGWISSNGGWMAMDKKRGTQHPVENDEKLGGVVTVTQNDETLPIDEADGPHTRVTIDTNSFQNVGEFNFASTITAVVAGRLQDDGYEVPEELKNCAQNMVLTKEGRLIAEKMKDIGDGLVNDRLLNQWFSKVILHAKLNQLNIGEVLLPIVEEILKGGINWGRIVMVIYLVYKLTIKEIDVTSLIFGIIKWVVQYLYKKLGGWEALVKLYYEATKSDCLMTVTPIAAMVAGILLLGGGVYYLIKK